MATRGLGTVLKVGTEGAAKTVGGLKEINGVSLSADTIDVTTLDSDGGYKEFIAGFKDAGEVSISGYFDPSEKGQKSIYDLFESGATSKFEIVFPASLGAKWVFDGVVTSFETSTSLEDPLSFSGAIKVSGKPTLTLTE